MDMTILKKIKAALIRLGNAIIESRQKSVDRQIARLHLSSMTDKELRDIGICRGDIRRVTN